MLTFNSSSTVGRSAHVDFSYYAVQSRECVSIGVIDNPRNSIALTYLKKKIWQIGL